jgi:aldehyde dehydrogenase (NAD+)
MSIFLRLSGVLPACLRGGARRRPIRRPGRSRTFSASAPPRCSLTLNASSNTMSPGATPPPRQPLAATDLYQVFDTSDVPGGVINIVTGERDELAKTLAEHDDVACIWYCGSKQGSAAAEAASAGNLKATWVSHGKRRDWLSRMEGQGHDYLRRAVQIKNIWNPYGE